MSTNRSSSLFIVFVLSTTSTACRDSKPKESAPVAAETPGAVAKAEVPAAPAAPSMPADCASACTLLLDCKVARDWFMAGVSIGHADNCKQICDAGRDAPEFWSCLKNANGCTAMSECWRAHDSNMKKASAAAPVPPAPAAPAVAELEVGKTVSGEWDGPTPREVVWTAAPGTKVRLRVVSGKDGESEELRASVGGKEQAVTSFAVNPARGGVLSWHALADGGLLVSGTSSAASQDEGGASVVRLTWDAAKRKVKIAKTWDGSDLDKFPAWAKALQP